MNLCSTLLLLLIDLRMMDVNVYVVFNSIATVNHTLIDTRTLMDFIVI